VFIFYFFRLFTVYHSNSKFPDVVALSIYIIYTDTVLVVFKQIHVAWMYTL